MEIAVILYNVRSLHNVGSVFRTADGAGVKVLYLCGFTPSVVDRFNKTRPQIAKTALGAERFVHWEKVLKIDPLIRRLKDDGYMILAIEQAKKSLPYYAFKPKRGAKIALIFGNEVRGIPPAVLKKSDQILEIPMCGKKESLNVSVAAGVALFGIIYLIRSRTQT
mgnify:CR=1 FL=1